jgi:iron complex transport system substrate-binding protein
MKKLLLLFLLLYGIIFPAQVLASFPRYVSITPATTEILFALGLDTEIVGVSSFCNYPAGVKNKTKVGDFSSPNAELILSLRPDYVFATGLEQDLVVEKLKRLKLKVYVSDPSNVEELFKTITDMGRITEKSVQADALIKSMKKEIEAVGVKIRRIPKDKRPKVFMEIWKDPLITAGKGSFIDELITLAGGINVAHDTIRPYSNFSAEKVLNLNPGFIFLAYMDGMPAMETVSRRTGWKNIEAVKNKKVFNDINPDILLRPGPRITQGIREIYARLYP